VAAYTSATAVTGLTAGTKYYFICTAVGTGESLRAAETSDRAGATSAPTFAVAPSSAQNVITITAPTTGTATSYNIYWDDADSAVTAANMTHVVNTATATAAPFLCTTATSCTHSGLTNGKMYRYAVAAVNANGESAPSAVTNVSMAVPSAPTGVGVNALTATTAAVSWTAPTTGGTVTYNVYHSTTAGTGTAGTKISNKTSSTTASVGPAVAFTTATPYYFVVTATNGFGESAASNETGAKLAANATGAPTVVRASAAGTTITLTWTAAATASYYNVYYSSSATMTTANGTKITAAAPGGATTLAVPGLTPGVGYYFIVTGVTAAGVETASQTLYAVVPL
jgi:fibronectin type 3 domain-containing protein